MATEDAQQTPSVPVDAPAATPSQPASDAVTMSSTALKTRLEEERDRARRALLKDLGFEKATEAAAVLKAAREKADAELSEIDRLKKQLSELSPKAEKLTALETRFASMVEREFAALPDNIRGAIDEIASGNAEERLRMIDVFRKSGLIGSAPAAAGEPPAPMARPASNGAAPPAPKPATQRTKHDEFIALDKSNPMAAAIFYAANKREIEATRPQS